METQQKDLVWLPIDLCKKIKEIEGNSGIEKEILSYIESTKLDFKQTIESIDEDVLLYRAKMIQARDSFKKAKDEELELAYNLWKDYDNELSKIRNYVGKAKETLEPLIKEVNSLNGEIIETNNLISRLNVDRLKGFLTIVNDCKILLQEDKDLLIFILENYKK
jgi:hypothetical protein